MLYLRKTNTRLALKLFRGEPAISGFDWNFSPIHTSSPPFSTDAGLTLHCPPRQSSTWTWIDHPVSGLLLTDSGLLRLGFLRPAPSVLNLASQRNSCSSTKSRAVHHIKMIYSLQTYGFRFFFTPLPGVLSPFLHSTTVYCAIGH